MHWLLHILGVDSVTSHSYAWWSGAAGSVGELAIIGGLVRVIREHIRSRRHHEATEDHAAATRQIMADLYKHATGKTHPDAPNGEQ